MSGVRYQDRSAHSLRLRLYDRAVDRSGLAVFARGEAASGRLRIEAAVIGSSHWVEVRADRRAFVEMLACHPAPAARPVAMWRPGESAVEARLPGGAEYSFEARTVLRRTASGSLDDLRRLVSLAALVSDEVGLAVEFPPPAGASRGAETLVWAAVGERAVTARTAHSYPAEGLVVLSRTRIKLPVSAGNRESKAMATAA